MLGSDFERLPPVLRAFHGATGGATARGVLRVRHGPSRLARVLARALRVPPEGDEIPVTLLTVPRGDGEIWDRTFRTSRLRTTQSLSEGKLVEYYGASALTFHVTADDHGMRFRSADFTWLGIRPPGLLRVQVDADVQGFESYWELAVVVRMPRLGVITSYEGRLAPTAP